MNKPRSGAALPRAVLALLGAVLVACFVAIIPVATRGWRTPRASPNDGAASPQPAKQDAPSEPMIGEGATPAGSAGPTNAGPEERAEDWEAQIEELLARPIPPEEAGLLLLNLLPNLPNAGQIAAADHLANLLSDEDFPKVGPILFNPNTPIEVLDALFFELINREDPVRMPLLLGIARLPGHPYQDDARDSLEMVVGEDLGDDWGAWQAAIKAKLQESQ